MQNFSESGALLPPVVLGSMLVAICGQTLQTLTQAFTVLHLELLHAPFASLLESALHHFHCLWSANLVDISPELHQQGDGFSCCNSVVDVVALQTLLQLWQMSKSWATGHNHHRRPSTTAINDSLQM